MTKEFRVDLSDRVAVVTGASRGAGRAIAAVLGETGATVYVTGRSVRGGRATEGRSGTIEDGAELVSQRGGIGIAVRCDHTLDADVERLFEHVRRQRGRLDLLVNNAWGGYEQRGETDAPFFDAPFWQQPLWRWDAMFIAGVRAHFVAARLAVPLLLEQGGRRPKLIVSTIAWAFGAYLGGLWDGGGAARERGGAAVAVAPGHLGVTESPEYLGRAVATLAADPNVMEKSGRLLTVGELAREYGFTDIDGTQPEPFRVAIP